VSPNKSFAPDNPFALWVDNQIRINPQTPMALAVSGGPDSMALAHMAVTWSQSSKTPLHILTVDHGLRAAARSEAQMVATWVKSQEGDHIHHVILNWKGEKPDASIMESARNARYHLMAKYCNHHKIETLFVAHHQDDQAETFLIRLAKGSGLDGLSGMREVRSYSPSLKIVRPLLNTPKQDLISYCTKYDVPYIHDPSNENRDYLRPRLRQSMEVLAQEGLTSKRLALTAKRLARARQALYEIADSAFQACLLDKTDTAYVFNFKALQAYPEEIALRVIQRAVESFRTDADYNIRMENMEDLFDSLWHNSQHFKPRTLGKCIFSLKSDKQSKNLALWIEKEDQ